MLQRQESPVLTVYIDCGTRLFGERERGRGEFGAEMYEVCTAEAFLGLLATFLLSSIS